jgi:PleD family two-component response regulator
MAEATSRRFLPHIALPFKNWTAMKSSSAAKLESRDWPTGRDNVVSIVVVDPRPDDYAAVAAKPRPGVWWQFLALARHALRTASTRRIDLWVVNFSLPDIPGLDLCRMLREGGPMDVFLIADQYNVEDERAARDFGAALFACKPVHAEWFDIGTPSRTSWRELASVPPCSTEMSPRALSIHRFPNCS